MFIKVNVSLWIESLENIRFFIRITSSPQTKSQDVDYFFKTTLSVTHRQRYQKEESDEMKLIVVSYMQTDGTTLKIVGP